MRLINLLGSFIVFLSLISLCANAQEIPVDTVCSGSEEFYKVNKTEGSVYEWKIVGNGMPVFGIDEKSDSIVVKWEEITEVTEASLQVVETNQFGFSGSPVALKIIIFPIPSATISGSDTLLEGNNGTKKVKIDLVGTAPWEVIYNDGSRDVTVDNINDANYILESRPLAYPPLEHVFNLVKIEDVSGCSGSVSGEARIVVAPKINTGSIIHR